MTAYLFWQIISITDTRKQQQQKFDTNFNIQQHDLHNSRSKHESKFEIDKPELFEFNAVSYDRF